MAPAGQEDDITRRFDALYAQVPHSLVDIGHREIGIEIGGPAATLVLAAACPLDLAGMPAGTGTRTIFDTVQIVLIKPDDASYRVEVWRSFAPLRRACSGPVPARAHCPGGQLSVPLRTEERPGGKGGVST